MSEANCGNRARQLLALRQEAKTAAMFRQQAEPRGAACEKFFG